MDRQNCLRAQYCLSVKKEDSMPLNNKNESSRKTYDILDLIIQK